MTSTIAPIEVPEARRFTQLSHEQRLVCRLIADGYTNKEIAVLRQKAKKTIDRHVADVMLRLKIHRRVVIARWWFSHRDMIAQLATAHPTPQKI